MFPALILALALLSTLPGAPLTRLAAPEEPAAVGSGADGTAPGSAAALAGAGEVNALARAWPDRVEEISLRGGEWMLRLDGRWFAWANGRLLPEEERGRWAEYDAYPFSRYPLELPAITPLDPETEERLVRRLRDAEENPPRRSGDFLGLLLHAGSRTETEARIIKMEVAGYTVSVHERLREPLTRVSEELSALRHSDPQAAMYLRSLAEINGYNFRYVEGTRSRSYHSYGLAVDLIPKSYAGKEAYWMWAANRHARWWEIPYQKRWMAPEAVVRCFERHGFIWGGKWLLFDTMHFEYRPELLILAGAGL
jgi:hypothetical protein